MPVAIDTSVLLHLIKPDAPAANDPTTKKPIANAHERVQHLVSLLEKQKQKLIVPTPVLSEVMVREVHKVQEHLRLLKRYSCINVRDFDEMAAIELALMRKEAIEQGGEKKDLTGSREKIKFDRQIIAIAKVAGATAIYSCDEDIAKLGERYGIDVIHLAQIALPPEAAQTALNLPSSNPERDITK